MVDTSHVRFPSIEGLRAFEVSARLGSFERAAEELSITASAVSKRVAAVEDLLATPLLVRGLRGLVLTAAGKEYLEHVRSALALLASVPLHHRGVQRRQRLRVSSPPTFARQILVPALRDFESKFPEVELEVVLSIPFLDGTLSDADVDVRNGDLRGPGVTLLMDDVVVPMASPSLVAERGGMPQRPEELVRWPLLRTPLEPWMPWWQAAGLAWTEPAEGHRLVDLGMVMEAAAQGLGVALARPSLAERWLLDGALVPLFSRAAVPRHLYYAVCNTAQATGGAFVEWLAAHAQAAAVRARERISGMA